MHYRWSTNEEGWWWLVHQFTWLRQIWSYYKKSGKIEQAANAAANAIEKTTEKALEKTKKALGFSSLGRNSKDWEKCQMTASECVTASPLSIFTRNDRSYQKKI